jgi:phosphotransferase system enzyme I (PtsI)
MKIIKGIPVSPGIVIGRVRVLDDAKGRRIPKRVIEQSEVNAEVARFDTARDASIAELMAVHKTAAEEMGEETAKIFLFHIGALSDKALVEPIRAMIAEEAVSAEYAVARVFRDWIEKFASRKDAAFRTKVNDLQDLADRLLNHLMGGIGQATARFKEPGIVAARDLTPSQTAGFERDKVLAMATDLGGPTSHTAIVARALGLPAVVGCRRLTFLATDGEQIIVDGDRGRIVLDPDDETIEEYRARITQRESFALSLKETADLPAVTTDGVEIELLGNIEFPEEAEAVLEMGGVGVGLYRTEFLYLTGDREPTEEDHYRVYKQCIDALGGKPLTIRTVDLGADKYTQQRAEFPERNPFLGLRSIRYCLQHMPMFKTQLRALLRASAHGPVKIMFPLITTLHEFRQARHLLNDADGGPRRAGHPPRPQTPRRHDGRGPLRRRHGRFLRPGGRFLLHRHQRPRPVHPRRRPHQRAGRLALHAHPPRGHQAHPRHRPGREAAGNPRFLLRRIRRRADLCRIAPRARVAYPLL